VSFIFKFDFVAISWRDVSAQVLWQ